MVGDNNFLSSKGFGPCNNNTKLIIPRRPSHTNKGTPSRYSPPHQDPPPNPTISNPRPNYNMSAPNAGRQSPDPERQSGAQQGVTASKPNDQGAASSENQPKEESEQSLKNLDSNPKSALEDVANAKTSKGTGNDSGAK